MRTQYREQVKILVDMKKRYAERLNLLDEAVRRCSLFDRLFTAGVLAEERIVYVKLLHAVNVALMKARRHYRWEYTRPFKRNPLDVPVYIEWDTADYGLLLTTIRTYRWQYFTFQK